MENHPSVNCISTYTALKCVHPRECCELHLQAGVAAAAAGDCATALRSEKKRHVG